MSFSIANMYKLFGNYNHRSTQFRKFRHGGVLGWRLRMMMKGNGTRLFVLIWLSGHLQHPERMILEAPVMN